MACTQVVTSTLASLSTGAKKEQLAQVEANKDGALPCVGGLRVCVVAD